MPATLRIETVVSPVSPRDCWGIFAEGRRIYGPANLYDCLSERDRLVSEMTHGLTLHV